MSVRSFLVIQHDELCPPALFGQILQERGYAVHVLRPDRSQPVPTAPIEHDALIVLGGPMNAGDDESSPWLPAVRALIARTVASGTAYLGICLGHQLAALALGGRVEPNPGGTTIGALQISRTQAGHDDPLLGGLPDSARGVHWHQDVVTELPASAVVLARTTDGYPQAVRYAPRAWGVQFHPEVTPSIFAGWADPRWSGLGPAEQARADQVAARVEGACDELVATWTPFAVRFAELATAVVRR